MKPEILKSLQPVYLPLASQFSAADIAKFKMAVNHCALDLFDQTSMRVISVVAKVGILFIPAEQKGAPYFVIPRDGVCCLTDPDRLASATEPQKMLAEKFVRDEFDDAVCKYNAATWNRTVYITTFVPHVRVKP
jgi:hypothetical protein